MESHIQAMGITREMEKVPFVPGGDPLMMAVTNDSDDMKGF
jgi:hypothetical protein